MANSVNFDAYRSQMTAIDLLHLALITIVVLVQVTLSVIAELTQNLGVYFWVPFLGATLLGLIVRLEVMVHRIGGFLHSRGDPWELAKATHAPTRYLMPIADVLCMVTEVVLLWISETAMWMFFFRDPAAQWGYLSLTLLLVALGVAAWILGALKAHTGFESVSHEE